MIATSSECLPQVSFVLPSYNEEANITTAIESALRAARRLCSDFEILVVDDGSTDATAELVQRVIRQEPSIKLLRHGSNRGYGEALRSGFSAAKMEFVFFTDADNQFDLDELESLLAWAYRADVVAGYRKVRRDPFLRRINAWGWNRVVRWLFYVPVRDIDCAFKLFKRETLQQIDFQSRGAMINTEIMVKLARRGCTIVEVGVSHFPRTSGDAHGARLAVIARAFREVKMMYPHLTTLSMPSPAEDLVSYIASHGIQQATAQRSAPTTAAFNERDIVPIDMLSSALPAVALQDQTVHKVSRRKRAAMIEARGNGAPDVDVAIDRPRETAK
jgi:GT2 family glycosyltransferase